MNEVQYTEQALNDIERVTDFLLSTDPKAAAATVGIIFEVQSILTHSPEIGRKVRSGLRELVISRGSSGYLALYHFFRLPKRCWYWRCATSARRGTRAFDTGSADNARASAESFRTLRERDESQHAGITGCGAAPKQRR